MTGGGGGILGELKPIPDYAEEIFDRVIGVNVKGVWLGLKYVAPPSSSQTGAFA